MANTQRDLNGWQVVTTDEHGNIIGDDRRRSRKRGGAELAFLQRLNDGLTFGRGDSVIMKDPATGSYSVYLIHEIRLNTLNNIVELWAFSYLRWFELQPQFYYAKFEPELAAENRPPEFYRDKLVNEIDKGEIYLTAELSEIWLKDFLAVANIMDEAKRKEVGEKFEEDKDFLVRYICEPTGENFAPFNIAKERKLLLNSDPKGFEEHLKRLSVPKSLNSQRKSSHRRKHGAIGKGAPISSDIKLEPDTDSASEDSDDAWEANVSKVVKPSKSPEVVSYKEESDSSPDTSSSPSSGAYDDAQETSESSPVLVSRELKEREENGKKKAQVVPDVSSTEESANDEEKEPEFEPHLVERLSSEPSLTESDYNSSSGGEQEEA